MVSTMDLLQQGRADQIWQKYCGFIDLSFEEFMRIQNELLMEQIKLLGTCELGRKLLGERVPADVDEFRHTVALTTYQDYLPYLPEKREDALPLEQYIWVRTSGRSGEHGFKWVPYSEKLNRTINAHIFGMLVFASSSRRGELIFERDDVTFAVVAPPPYVSGAISRGLEAEFPFRFIPPLDQAETMDFQARVEEGFRLALSQGLDVFYGLSSVLMKVGERFEQRSGKMDPALLLSPKVLARMAKGWLRSRLAGRPMLPRDLWNVKAIICGGTDTAVYRQKIEAYWGKSPVEAFGGTESGIISVQTWGESLTFLPDVSFLEFIPEAEHLKWKENPSYQPQVLTLAEVEPGAIYEVVTTSLHGGAFVRYRLGDLVRITARRDERHGIDIPQMVFYARADGVIDLGSFARLTEQTIAWALEHAQVRHNDWCITKELWDGQPILHLYLEPASAESRREVEIGDAFDAALQALDTDYRDLKHMLETSLPLVTFLNPGTFQCYALEKQAAGADLGHLKPVRMQPSAQALATLIRLSQERTIHGP
jgi:hypothetical protein